MKDTERTASFNRHNLFHHHALGDRKRGATKEVYFDPVNFLVACVFITFISACETVDASIGTCLLRLGQFSHNGMIRNTLHTPMTCLFVTFPLMLTSQFLLDVTGKRDQINQLFKHDENKDERLFIVMNAVLIYLQAVAFNEYTDTHEFEPMHAALAPLIGRLTRYTYNALPSCKRNP